MSSINITDILELMVHIVTNIYHKKNFQVYSMYLHKTF